MSGQAREEFLATVRRALGRDGPLPEAPVPPGGLASVEEQERHVQAIQERLAGQRQALVDALADMAAKAGWKVARATTPDDALLYITALAKEQVARLVVRTHQPVFARVNVDGALGGEGVRVVVMAAEAGTSREESRSAAAEADMGITGVDYAIAETGTCVLVPGKGVSRLTSLLPPIHVAIVETERILGTLDDLLALRKLEFLRGGDLGSYMNFITGPSRSGDIEQTITVGVHGPREVHLVILEP